MPRGKSCRRAGRSGTQALPSPYDTAFSEGSGSLSVLTSSSPITFTSPSSKARQKSGSFAPPHYPVSMLIRPCPTPAAVAACRDVEAATLTRDGSPPITRTTFPTCRAHYPGGSSGCVCRLLPRSRGLPQMAGGSAFRIVTFEACSGFTHVTARRIAQPPKATFVTRLQPYRLPGRAARQSPG